MAENSKNNLIVQEKQYMTAEHKKEDKNVKNMTVAQRINYLEVKQKQKGLTPQEHETLENLKEEEGKKTTKLKNENLKNEKDKDEDEPKDIFKDEDILKYMYNEWLLGGANWLFKKTYKGVDKIGDWTYRQLSKIPEHIKKDPKKENVQMVNYIEATDKHSELRNKKTLEQEDPGITRLKETFQRFRDGNATEEEKRSNLYNCVQELSPREREAFFTSTIQKMENASNNIKLMKAMGTMLARNHMIQNQMNQENPSTFNKDVFEARAKLFTAIIAKEAQKSNDPELFLNQMYQNIEESSKTINKDAAKGKYQARGKTPSKNSALERIYKKLNVDSKTGHVSDERLHEINNEPQTLVDALVHSQDVAKTLNERIELMKAQDTALGTRQQDYENRKKQYLARIHRDLNPVQKQTTNKNMQQLLNGRNSGR